MVKTVITSNIGAPDLGYVLLALPSDNFKNHVQALLRELAAELPGVIWAMPTEQLHITLCEIIQPKDYREDKEMLFDLHRQQYESVPAEVLSKLSKLTVTFDTLEVSSQAIILRAGNSDMFNSIRANLVAGMELPAETRIPPDITHSSIARYAGEIELEKVQEVVARYSITIEEHISEFKLVRTTVLPLQEYEVLRTYRLVGGNLNLF